MNECQACELGADTRKKRMRLECENPGCSKEPAFNVEGATTRRFCATHKLAGMVNVKNKRCENPGCNSLSPVFNVEGATTGRFCTTHKLAGMVNVKSKRCENPGCNSLGPVFNVEGTTTGRFCATHKLAGMVDVKSKRCENPGCTTRASYGLPGHKASWCASHHPCGTMKHPTRKCTSAKCQEPATHGITQPERCEHHSLKGDDNLVERECLSCLLPNVVNATGMCSDCHAWSTGKRPRLAKQREVVQFLEAQFTEYPYDSTDRTPQHLKDCNRKERPDVIWDLADRVVILEVDEDQHKDRACECEQTRMMNISQALGSERTVWIRYNPDAFKSPESRKWTTKAKRHEVLKQWLSWALTKELSYTISVVYLFFDGFREGAVQVEKFL